MVQTTDTNGTIPAPAIKQPDTLASKSEQERNKNNAIMTSEQGGGIAFLALLFNLFTAEENGTTPEQAFIDFTADLGIDNQQAYNLFQEFKNTTNPVQSFINSTDGADLIRNRYNVGSPATIATGARNVFTQHEGDAWEAFLEHLTKREGYENEVYKDSEGHLTVGVGHLVTSQDIAKYGWAEGDRISDEMVMSLLKEDASEAYQAAINDAKDLNMVDKGTVISLASVNYQLGTGWNEEFSQTWAKMKAGNFEGAIGNVEQSLWNKQTPVRVDDFQSGLAHMAEIRDGNVQIASLDGSRTSLSGNFDDALAANTPLQTDTAQPNPLPFGEGVDQVAAAVTTVAAPNTDSANDPNFSPLAIPGQNV